MERIDLTNGDLIENETFSNIGLVWRESNVKRDENAPVGVGVSGKFKAKVDIKGDIRNARRRAGSVPQAPIGIKQGDVLNGTLYSNVLILSNEYERPFRGNSDMILKTITIKDVNTFEKVPDSTPITPYGEPKQTVTTKPEIVVAVKKSTPTATTTVTPPTTPTTTPTEQITSKKDAKLPSGELVLNPKDNLSFFQRNKVAIIATVSVLTLAAAVFMFRNKLFKGVKK